MVTRTITLLGLGLVLASCSTANEYYQPIEIVGGPAHIVGVEARDVAGARVLADLSSSYTGGLATGSDRVIYGLVGISGVTTSVYGLVKDQDDGLVFEMRNLIPNEFRVRTDPGDLYHYTLVAMNIQQADLTGDSIPDQYRLFIFLDKTPE